MTRQTFLKSIIAAVPIFGFISKLKAQPLEQTKNKEGFMVKTNEDRFDQNSEIFGGDRFSTKVSTRDTDGAFYIFDSTRLKKGGPGLHFHYEQDEWWYVIKGEFSITVGGKTYIARAGDSVFGPRMVPHKFSKTNEGESKLIIMYQPAGRMEEFFKKVGNGALQNLTKPELESLCKEHGFEVL
jgi:mannose-6-phosphate isomerase-like protein (cupin superfamily)